jgi:tRNA pseudouridine38-40 synthase
MGRGGAGLTRYALLVHYDGTLFSGWQIQDKGRTVQDEIEKGIHVLTREKVRITASGRTDAGVHALGQVVDLEREIVLQRLCTGLNGIFPEDISVKNAYRVGSDFHSRFSAVKREYIYLIYSSPLRSPFMKNRALWTNPVIDSAYIKEVLAYITGEMDFASFCKKISAENGTVRKIEYTDVTKKDDIISIKICANAFLHNMIRIIIGTIVTMYREGRDPSYIKKIIDEKDRESSGYTAPPHGLYLKRVFYDPPLDNFESAF